MPSTAAIIIIGNEILSGKFHDSNSAYLASGLRELGVDVRRISVIPDDVEVIADEVSKCSAEFDHVFTSGGVGPTHDDVTMEGVARAFSLGLVCNENLASIIRQRCGQDPRRSAAACRIARSSSCCLQFSRLRLLSHGFV